MTTATTTSGLRLDASGLSIAVASAEATAIDLCLTRPADVSGATRWNGRATCGWVTSRASRRATATACARMGRRSIRSVLLLDPLARAVDGRWSVALPDVPASSAPLRRRGPTP